MKKFLLVLVLLPLFSFGGLDPDFVEFVNNPTNILYFRGFTYNSNGSFSYTNANGTRDTLTSFVIGSVRLGVQVNPLSQWVNHPAGDNESFPTSPSIDYPVTRYYDRSHWYNMDYLPDLHESLYICCNLISSGYRSSVVEVIYDYSNNVTCNFRIGDVFRDVLTGTNTIFRSQLLSQLSKVNGSLQTLALSLGTVSADYKTVNNLYLDPSKQNLLDSAANPSSLNANSSIAANLDRLFGSSYAGRESEITKALSDLARSQLQAAWLSTLDPDSPFYMQNLDNILSDPSTFQQAALQGGGGGGSALANIMRDVKKLSTNDWVSGVTNQLANNRASITNQLAHMFDDDNNPVVTPLNSIAGDTQSIDQRLANGITVAVVNSGANSVLVSLDGPINIDSTQFNSLSVPLGSLQTTVSDWYSDWYSFFSVSSPSYKWENFYNMVSAFKDQNHFDLVAVTNSLSSLSSLSNVLASIDDQLKNAFPNITNLVFDSSPFSALLLDHYEDYITNSVYADSISKLQSDYPSVYSNLVDFGLSPSGDGDFWSLFGSSLIQLDLLADNFISDMALVRKFADDNIQGGFSAGISSIIEVMPKKEDIVSSASAASNIVSALDLSSTNLVTAFHSVTSHADSVFTPFHGSFDTVPSDLVLFKTGNDKYITIPVHEHPEAFRLMRWGFSFALAAVNFIFFPKFVLMLVMLFSKLSQRFVKFYPSVKDE